MKFNKLVHKLLEEFDVYNHKHTYHPGSEFYSLTVYYTGYINEFVRVPESWYDDWRSNPHEDKIICYEGSNLNKALETFYRLYNEGCDGTVSINVIKNQIDTQVEKFRHSVGMWLVASSEGSITIAFDKDAERTNQYQGEHIVSWTVKAFYDYNTEEGITVEPIRRLNNEEHRVFDRFKEAVDDDDFNEQYGLYVCYVGNNTQQAYHVFEEWLNGFQASNSQHVIERALRDARILANTKDVINCKVIAEGGGVLYFIAEVDMTTLKAQQINKDLEGVDTTGFEDLL